MHATLRPSKAKFNHFCNPSTQWDLVTLYTSKMQQIINFLNDAWQKSLYNSWGMSVVRLVHIISLRKYNGLNPSLYQQHVVVHAQDL